MEFSDNPEIQSARSSETIGSYNESLEWFKHVPISKRHKKLFNNTYVQGQLAFEDVLIAYGDRQLARFEQISTFVTEADNRGQMNLILESNQDYSEYHVSIRRSDKHVRRYQSKKGGIVQSPVETEEARLVWAVIDKVSKLN